LSVANPSLLTVIKCVKNPANGSKMKISIVVLAFAVSADAFSPVVIRKPAAHRFAMIEDEIDFDGENITSANLVLQ
jgi:hypothetical protein